MSSRAMAKAVLESMKLSPIVRVGKPASERHVARCEAELGVKLPGVYRELVKLAGQIDIWDQSMFGLGPSAEKWEGYEGITVTDLTQMARQEGNVRLPEHLVAIWHDCHQDYQCLDTSRVKGGDCPIVLFDTEIAASARRRPKRVASGLAAWLELRIKAATELKARIEADDAAAEEEAKLARARRKSRKKKKPATRRGKTGRKKASSRSA